MIESSNSKVAYSAEVVSAMKAGQISDKLQGSNFKFWCLVFGVSLVFGVWCLNFKRSQGAF